MSIAFYLTRSCRPSVCAPRPHKVTSWSSNPCMAVLGNQPLRKSLRLNEVIKVGPWPHRISVLTRRELGSSRSLFLHTHGHQGKATWGPSERGRSVRGEESPRDCIGQNLDRSSHPAYSSVLPHWMMGNPTEKLWISKAEVGIQFSFYQLYNNT